MNTIHVKNKPLFGSALDMIVTSSLGLCLLNLNSLKQTNKAITKKVHRKLLKLKPLYEDNDLPKKHPPQKKTNKNQPVKKPHE